MYSYCIVNTNLNKMAEKSFKITKKVAKHGSQSVIVIPKLLEKQLKPGTVTQVTINVLEEEKNE